LQAARRLAENPTYFGSPSAEERALALLKAIVEENCRLLKLEDDRLSVSTQEGRKYSIDLGTAKVYDGSGKFICMRVQDPNLPVIDQVIAKSLYLLSYPDPLSTLDHNLVFKLTLAGVEPSIEWPWIRSMSYSTLGETYSSLIGADFAVKGIRVGDLVVKLQLWYVNYDDRFKSIRSRHVKGSMGGIILCTGTSKMEKVDGFQSSIDELRYCNGGKLPLVFVGLYDQREMHGMEREALKVGEAVARRNGIPFFPCSLNHPSTARKPLTYIVDAILGRRNTIVPSN
jgi:hypothetical protein